VLTVSISKITTRTAAVAPLPRAGTRRIISVFHEPSASAERSPSFVVGIRGTTLR
jgi:hypothetical protein